MCKQSYSLEWSSRSPLAKCSDNLLYSESKTLRSLFRVSTALGHASLDGQCCTGGMGSGHMESLKCILKLPYIFHEVVSYIVLRLVASSLWNPGYSFSASRRSAIESWTSWSAQIPYVWRKGLVTSMPSKIKNPRAMFWWYSRHRDH